MKNEEKYRQELLDLMQRVAPDKKLLDDFLIDLFSPVEYQEIVKRWQIVKLLAKGMSQRAIAENLKVSIATITRGSRMLLNKKGGFNQVLAMEARQAREGREH